MLAVLNSLVNWLAYAVTSKYGTLVGARGPAMEALERSLVKKQKGEGSIDIVGWHADFIGHALLKSFDHLVASQGHSCSTKGKGKNLAKSLYNGLFALNLKI